MYRGTIIRCIIVYCILKYSSYAHRCTNETVIRCIIVTRWFVDKKLKSYTYTYSYIKVIQQRNDVAAHHIVQHVQFQSIATSKIHHKIDANSFIYLGLGTYYYYKFTYNVHMYIGWMSWGYMVCHILHILLGWLIS